MKVSLVSSFLLSVDGARHATRTRQTCGLLGARTTEINTSRIVNGQPADECVWKWQVGLRNQDIGLPWCGGQIINEDWILTAAHCGSRPDYMVVAGEWKPKVRSGNEQNRDAVQVIRHPQYLDSRSSWDLALVRVNESFVFNDCVGEVCLPDPDAPVAPGTTCTITGWGTLRSGGQQPDILMEGDVATISNSDCGTKYGYTASQITPDMLCAQGRNANGGIVDACQGDSGGPLVCEENGAWVLHGATSWGRGCAGANYPGVWAKITAFSSWIEATLAANSGPAPTRPPALRCPDFARYPSPDSDGDCACRSGERCSTNGGASINCPTSGGNGGYGGSYFSADCTTCMCYPGIFEDGVDATIR